MNEGKFKKITNKVMKGKNTFVWGICNSRLKPKISTKVIAKHYLIVAYCMCKVKKDENECKTSIQKITLGSATT